MAIFDLLSDFDIPAMRELCEDILNYIFTMAAEGGHGGAFATPVRGSATSIAPLHQDKIKTKQKNQPFYSQIWDFCSLRDTLCPLNICLKKNYFHFAQKVHFKQKKKNVQLRIFCHLYRNPQQWNPPKWLLKLGNPKVLKRTIKRSYTAKLNSF